MEKACWTEDCCDRPKDDSVITQIKQRTKGLWIGFLSVFSCQLMSFLNKTHPLLGRLTCVRLDKEGASAAALTLTDPPHCSVSVTSGPGARATDTHTQKPKHGTTTLRHCPKLTIDNIDKRRFYICMFICGGPRCSTRLSAWYSRWGLLNVGQWQCHVPHCTKHTGHTHESTRGFSSHLSRDSSTSVLSWEILKIIIIIIKLLQTCCKRRHHGNTEIA